MILVTGAAGFIGFHVCKRLLEDNYTVVGIDNINDYYDTYLKEERLSILREYSGFTFYKIDIDDQESLSVLKEMTFDYIVHLAAQAGVRYSIDNPMAYVQSNIVGFLNLLEWMKSHPVKHFIYASSSSVYGGNKKVPFQVIDTVDNPVSFYAATKKSNELMAHVYSHMYKMPLTGLRFFTVYGPYGRPDMAYYKFAKKMMAGETIDVYGHGELARDFTYIDDIVEAIIRLLDKPSKKEVPYQLFNIGYGKPIGLLYFIELLEDAMSITAEKRFLPMQPGDVVMTYADVSGLKEHIDYEPKVSFEEGIKKFVTWFKEYEGGETCK